MTIGAIIQIIMVIMMFFLESSFASISFYLYCCWMFKIKFDYHTLKEINDSDVFYKCCWSTTGQNIKQFSHAVKALTQSDEIFSVQKNKIN